MRREEKRVYIKCIHNLSKTAKLIRKFDPKFTVITIIAAILEGLFSPASLLVMQQIINLIQTSKISMINEIIMYVGIYIGIDFLNLLEQSIVSYYKTSFSLNFNLMLKKRILQKASILSLKDYEDSDIYNMIERAQGQSDGDLINFYTSFFDVVSIMITSISYLVILLKFKAWLLPIVILIPIFKFLVSKKINLKQYGLVFQRTNEERKAWYYRYLITSGDSFKELKLYNLFVYFINKHDELINKFNLQDLKIERERTFKLTLLNVLEQIFNGAIFIYIIAQGLLGLILIGDVITFVRTITSTKNQIQILLQLFASIQQQSLFVDFLFQFFETETETTISKKIKVDEVKEIDIRHLYYKYKKEQEYVLKDVNLLLKKGDFITLVGKNGSGKSTLAKIIMGFYNDYEGKILINGIDFTDIDKECYQERIGALFQDFTKFEATFRENIGFGNLHIMKQDKLMYEIIELFNLTDVVDISEKGIDTQLGYWFDSGKQISLGQWQKIALSRAFARKADIFFLDEPNAAMDAISEYDMSILYEKLFANKLGVVIAHKFNNFVKKANCVIVLDEGGIVQTGTHDILIQNKEGLYFELYSLQTNKDT